MAIVDFGGSTGAQPAQGEMRRFIVRSRIDGRVTPVLAADANKAFHIKSGWLVRSVWPRLLVPGTTYGMSVMIDSGGITWGTTFASGGSIATAGLNGTSTPSPDFTQGSIGASGGKFFPSDGHMSASFTATFDGLMDIYAEAVNMNAYSSPANFSD